MRPEPPVFKHILIASWVYPFIFVNELEVSKPESGKRLHVLEVDL